MNSSHTLPIYNPVITLIGNKYWMGKTKEWIMPSKQVEWEWGMWVIWLKEEQRGRVGCERTINKKIVHVTKGWVRTIKNDIARLCKQPPDMARIRVGEKLSLESKRKRDHMIGVGAALYRWDFPGVKSSATPSLLLPSTHLYFSPWFPMLPAFMSTWGMPSQDTTCVSGRPTLCGWSPS